MFKSVLDPDPSRPPKQEVLLFQARSGINGEEAVPMGARGIRPATPDEVRAAYAERQTRETFDVAWHTFFFRRDNFCGQQPALPAEVDAAKRTMTIYVERYMTDKTIMPGIKAASFGIETLSYQVVKSDIDALDAAGAP